MSNGIYAKCKQALLEKKIDLLSDTIKAALVDDTYVLDLAADEFLSPAINTSILGTPLTLTAKSTLNGIFDAADATFIAIAAPATIAGIVIYQDTGAAATSRLIAWIDSATGLPMVADGGDVVIQWSGGPDKIFRL